MVLMGPFNCNRNLFRSWKSRKRDQSQHPKIIRKGFHKHSQRSNRIIKQKRTASGAGHLLKSPTDKVEITIIRGAITVQLLPHLSRLLI